MLQGCAVGSGQHLPGDPNPRGPQSPRVHHSPLPAFQPPGSLTLSPRSPRFPGKPCERRGVVREGPGHGCSWGGGYLPPALDRLLALGVHLHPVRRKRCEKGVWDGGTPRVTPPWRQAQCWLPIPSGLEPWDLPSPVVRPWGGWVRTQRGCGSTYPWPGVSTLASGSWQPGSWRTLPREAKSSSLSLPPTAPPSHAMSPSPCQGTPRSPPTTLGAWHRAGSHMPPSRVSSASLRGWLQQGHPTRRVVPLPHAIG